MTVPFLNLKKFCAVCKANPTPSRKTLGLKNDPFFRLCASRKIYVTDGAYTGTINFFSIFTTEKKIFQMNFCSRY